MDRDDPAVSELLKKLAKRGSKFDPYYRPEKFNALLAPAHEKIERALLGISFSRLTFNDGNALTFGANPIVLSETSREESIDLVLAMAERLTAFFTLLTSFDNGESQLNENVRLISRIIMSGFGFMDSLLTKKLPFTDDQLIMLLQRAEQTFEASEPIGFPIWNFPIKKIIGATENYVKAEGYTQGLDPVVIRLMEQLNQAAIPEYKKLAPRLARLNTENLTLCITAGEAWSDQAIAFIDQQSDGLQQSWKALLLYCCTANAGKPSKKWITGAVRLIESVGQPEFEAAVNQWFPLVGQPRTRPIAQWNEWMPDPNQMIVSIHADVLKGLVWMCGGLKSTEYSIALGRLGLVAYKKVSGVGPLSSKIGNATVWALGQIPDDSALAALAMLKVKIKFRPAQKSIGAALEVAAERVGMTAAELEEIGVPEFGLTSIGERREDIGDFTAIYRILNATKSELVWETSAGKMQKAVPKAIKDNFSEELKDLRQSGKDSLKMLSAIRERLDGYMRLTRQWKYQDWVACYWEHPLTGILVRSLIWTFRWADGAERHGIGYDKACVDSTGAEISDWSSAESVELWHPINSSEAEIVAWRSWLQEQEVAQPFKQAHREIYLLTDAERTTNMYSNRFASHIVKQHQFNVLCAARGWRSTTRLMVDDTYEPPTVELADSGLRAEYWVEGVGDVYGEDTTDAGSYLYLATDQVRFYSIDSPTNSAHAGGGGYTAGGRDTGANQPLPLADVPALALSEVLRDVDLFVGVSSVGNDPNWSDGGTEGRFIDYWNSYSFGELSQTAETRRVMLENLIPRLKIRDFCTMEDRFLKVEGTVRTYRIHLGSSNILMEPNDQYLCIVPTQAKSASANKVFLPFEGDSRLTTILSKAFLLAADDKITDKTILSQINRKA